MDTKLLKLRDEVIEINEKILKISTENNDIKELYKGCQIYFSPLIENPDLMLIGINPGAGYYKHNNNQIVQKFEPLEAYDEKYDLAQEIKYGVFRHIGREDIFNNTFKTNMYFFATENENALKKLFKLLPQDFRTEIKSKSIMWIKELIGYTLPKLILCEGFTAFDYLKLFYGNEMKINQNKGYVLEAEINNIPIVGCKRMGCNVIKKELVIKKLKEYYKLCDK